MLIKTYEAKQNFTENEFFNILVLFDALPNYVFNYNYEHGICELSHELPND